MFVKKKQNNVVKSKNLIQSISTLHGTTQLSILSGKNENIWKGILILNLIFTIAFLLVIKNRYNNDQIITRISNNCKLKQIPFPAISICNLNIVSKRESVSIIRLLTSHNITQKTIVKFLHYLPILKDYGKSTRDIDNFETIMSILKNHYFTVDSLMEEVHQKCENLLLYCAYNRKVKNCGDIFELIKTYEGYCCAFNYAALNDDGDISKFTKDEDIEYYEDPSGEAVQPNERIIVTSESGRGSGLSVIFNVEPEDYPVWSSTPYFGAKILLSDPNDYPEITVLYKLISLRESIDIKVEPMLFQCENDIRYVAPEKRGCWFHNEAFLEHTDRYSYETCKTECKMQRFLESCGCIPYKYPREKTTPVCEFKNLQCLQNTTAYRFEGQRPCIPVCYMECRDKRYSITSDLTPFVPELFPSNITNGRNISELSALQVYFAKSSCNTYNLMLLMDFNHFIATYGGIFTISFGASILTLCELVYLFVSFLLSKFR